MTIRKLLILLFVFAELICSQGLTGHYSALVKKRGTAVTYDADAQAYFDTLDAKSAPLDDTHKTAFNNFIVNIKSDLGISSLVDRVDMILFLGNEDTLAALTNAVYPTQVSTRLGAMVFVVDSGFTAATGKYINTLYNPSTDTVALSLDSASFTIYTWTTGATSGYDFGATDEANYIDISVDNPVADNRPSWSIFQASNTTCDSVIAYDNGNWTMTRRDNTDLELYHRGVSKDVATNASTALTNADIYIGQMSGTATTRQYFFFMIHDKVSDTEATNINQSVLDLIGDLGL